MRQIIFINTETNGLPPKGTYEVNEKNYNKWPNLVSLHYKIGTYNKRTREIEIIDKKYYIVKPENFKINKISKKFHGISNKIAEKNGNKIELILKKLKKDIKKFNIKIIVGHNINFDLNILKSELLRNKKKIDFDNKIIVDTINFHHNFEYPKLIDLHFKLFGNEYKKSHPRKSNINIIIKCFGYLYNEHVKNINIKKEKN